MSKSNNYITLPRTVGSSFKNVPDLWIVGCGTGGFEGSFDRIFLGDCVLWSVFKGEGLLMLALMGDVTLLSSFLGELVRLSDFNGEPHLLSGFLFDIVICKSFLPILGFLDTALEPLFDPPACF